MLGANLGVWLSSGWGSTTGAGNLCGCLLWPCSGSMWLEGCAPAGEIVNEILLSRAAWRRSRCRAQGWPHCFSSNPLPCSGAMQWRNGGKSLGWIPHISTHYGHFVDTDPDSGQGVRALASNQTVFILFWPICLVLHHISILINQYFEYWIVHLCPSTFIPSPILVKEEKE